MTPQDRQTAIDALREAITRLEAIPFEELETPCTECVHFDTRTFECLYHSGTVPVEFRIKGCESWSAMPF